MRPCWSRTNCLGSASTLVKVQCGFSLTCVLVFAPNYQAPIRFGRAVCLKTGRLSGTQCRRTGGPTAADTLRRRLLLSLLCRSVRAHLGISSPAMRSTSTFVPRTVSFTVSVRVVDSLPTTTSSITRAVFAMTGSSAVSRTSTKPSFRSAAVAGRSTGRRSIEACSSRRFTDSLTRVSVSRE